MVTEHHLSERRACRLVGLSRDSYRHPPQADRDSLSGGRRLKYLTVADDFSHESVDIAVGFGISGQYVTRVLDRAALFRRYPQAVRTDNGPEFTSRAFMAWAQAHGIRHILIQPGRPMQNGYIESFNGKFRDEHLNESWLQTLNQARMGSRRLASGLQRGQAAQQLGALSTGSFR